MGRAGQPLPAQFSRQFEGNQSAHTVSKEDERPVKASRERRRKRFDQAIHSRQRLLSDARFPSGKLYAAHLHFRREGGWPRAIDGGAAACVREAEKAHFGARVWAGKDDRQIEAVEH